MIFNAKLFFALLVRLKRIRKSLLINADAGGREIQPDDLQGGCKSRGHRGLSRGQVFTERFAAGLYCGWFPTPPRSLPSPTQTASTHSWLVSIGRLICVLNFYGISQRQLSQTQSGLSLSRNRPAHEGVLRREPLRRQAPHPL